MVIKVKNTGLFGKLYEYGYVHVMLCAMFMLNSTEHGMSLVVRKPVFGVSDQVTHKPGCTVTEDS